MKNKTSLFLAGMFFFANLSNIGVADNAPQFLSETGLYKNIWLKVIDRKNESYTPQYGLWSDGAEKQRWIYLPPKTQINTGVSTGPTPPPRGNIDYWIFPVGTKFWKEFSFPREDGFGYRRIETRMLEKVDDTTWNMVTYLWNDLETEAVLAPAEGIKDYYPSAPGYTHDIPSQQDCLSCHHRGGDAILGFDAIQLSPDRDPLAPHAEKLRKRDLTLPDLEKKGLVSYLAPELLQKPPVILSSTPEGRAAMGYFHANCGNCHNPSGPAGYTYLLFRYPTMTTSEDTSPVFMTAINKLSYQFRIPGEALTYRIKPGDPSDSAILYRMDHPANRMPPLGTKIVDAEAIALVQNWIERLAN
jgi:hypothetical protein